MSWAPLAAALVLLAVNAFFVTVEFALIATRRTFLEQQAGTGSRPAGWALRSSQELSVSLAGAQLGVTLASVALGFVAEPAVAHLLEPAFAAAGVSDAAAEVASFGVGLVIVVFAHMVIGEMVPKNLAIAGPERAALLVAGPLRLYTIVLGPVIRLLNWLANSVLRLAGVEPADELATAATADDLASMIAESRDEGFLDDFEEGFLSGALHFDDATAASVMVARDQIVAASASTTVAELEALVVETCRSRIPVYVETLDQVIGFFHAKALLDMPAEARGEPMAPRLLRPLLLVPPDRPLKTVLAGMRRGHTHIALVADASGSTVGLLTLQDVLGRLVGQINDENHHTS